MPVSFLDAVAELQDRDVEGASAEVVDGDGLILAAVLAEAVGQGCGGRLVDDPLDLESCDAAGVLGGLPLGIVEVGGNRDDGLADRLAKVVLGGLLHLHQDLGGDLLRAEQLAADVDLDLVAGSGSDLVGDQLDLLGDLVVLAAHEPLDGVDRVLRVRNHLVLRGASYDTLALALVSDDGRSGPVALGVRDDLGLIALHDSHAAVRGSQVDSNNLSHYIFSPQIQFRSSGGLSTAR